MLVTSSDAARVEGAEESELGPVEDSVVRSDFGDLFFVTLDPPEGADVVSVDEAVSIVLGGIGGVSVEEGTEQYLSCDIHLSNKII